MLKLSSLAFLVLVIVGCDNYKVRKSDKILTDKMGFEEVMVNPKRSDRVVLNVQEIEAFNSCQVTSSDGLYTLDHSKSDSLLIISDSLATKRDASSNKLGPFVSGYSFKIILGDKINNDSTGLSLHGHIAYKVVID